jgi:hypothetical protein
MPNADWLFALDGGLRNGEAEIAAKPRIGSWQLAIGN